LVTIVDTNLASWCWSTTPSTHHQPTYLRGDGIFGGSIHSIQESTTKVFHFPFPFWADMSLVTHVNHLCLATPGRHLELQLHIFQCAQRTCWDWAPSLMWSKHWWCRHDPHFHRCAKQTTPDNDESNIDERVNASKKVATESDRCNVCLAEVPWDQQKEIASNLFSKQ